MWTVARAQRFHSHPWQGIAQPWLSGFYVPMANPKVVSDDFPEPSGEVAPVQGGAARLGARKSSVKNLIKLFQPVSQEDKLARLSTPATESSSSTKPPVPVIRKNLNGSVRYA